MSLPLCEESGKQGRVRKPYMQRAHVRLTLSENQRTARTHRRIDTLPNHAYISPRVHSNRSTRLVPIKIVSGRQRTKCASLSSDSHSVAAHWLVPTETSADTTDSVWIKGFRFSPHSIWPVCAPNRGVFEASFRFFGKPSDFDCTVFPTVASICWFVLRFLLLG